MAVALKATDFDGCSVLSSVSEPASKVMLASESEASSQQTQRVAADEVELASRKALQEKVKKWLLSSRALLVHAPAAVWKRLHKPELAQSATAKSLLVAMEAVAHWSCYSGNHVSIQTHTGCMASLHVCLRSSSRSCALHVLHQPAVQPECARSALPS